MIPTKYAELLNLPPEIDPGEARRLCLQLQTELREQSRTFPPDNPDLPRLEERLGELEQFLNSVGADEASPVESPKPDAVSSEAVQDEIRATLDLGQDATPEEALTRAESRLKETIDAQIALKPKHPAHPKLRRDRQRFERMVADLQEIILTKNIESFCELASEALNAEPSDKAKAQDFLERARSDAVLLPPESSCLERLQRLEAQLKESDVFLDHSPSQEPDIEQTPDSSAPIPTSLPANPFLRLETLIDEGMACLAQDKPDAAAAREYFSDAALEAAGRGVPSNLRNRMQLFKRTLDQVRREAILSQADDVLKRSATAMAQKPPAIAEAREKLRVAEALLSEAPDAYFKSEVARQQRAIEEHEQWLALRRTEQHLLADAVPAGAPAQSTPTPGLRQASATVPLPVASKKIIPKQIRVARIATPRAASLANPPSVPESNQQPAFVPVAPAKRSRALEVGLALVFIALIAAVCAGIRIIKAMSTLSGHLGSPPALQPVQSPEKLASQPVNKSKPAAPGSAPQAESGEVSVSVSPPGAVLFTNGVSLGHADYPVFLTGLTGKEIELRAELDGYSNATRMVTFPTSQFPDDETLQLQPKPALLVVHSDPPAAEVSLRKEHSEPFVVARSDDGIEFSPGVPFEISLQVPDYDDVRTNLSALKPGERKLIDFGKLKLQTATLRLQVYPPDTQFSIVYLGREPIPCGSKTNLEDIIPRVAFELVAEHAGYASASNSFLLKPREVIDFDFGKLRPLSASLFVTATPAVFDLKVAWDGASKDYGSEGRAGGLPSGKTLLVTVSAAGHEPASTNLVLEPGEQKQLFFSGLQPAKSYLLLKSDPPGVDVTYSIDEHFPIDAGVTDHIDDLPLGHIIDIKLHKAGYVDRFMKHTLLLAGETLDFGHLLPSLDTNVIATPVPAEKPVFKPRRLYNAASIDKLLKDIDAHIIVISNNVPLTETSRRQWNEWIDKVAAMHRDNSLIWSRLETPLSRLREVVNRRSPFPTASIAKAPK